MLRPYVIAANLLTFFWFILLQLARFKDSGRACAGDYLDKVPTNFGSVYLSDQGWWLKAYIISQYVVYLGTKVVSIIITNRLEAQYDE